MNQEHVDRVCRYCNYLGFHRDFVMKEIADRVKPVYLTCNKTSHAPYASWYVLDSSFVIPADCDYSLEHLLIYDEKFLPQT